MSLYARIFSVYLGCSGSVVFLLENFRRAGRVCLWVLIIYEAKRCLFCLRTFGRLSLSARRPVPSLSLFSFGSSKRELSVACKYAIYLIASSMTSILETRGFDAVDGTSDRSREYSSDFICLL